MTKVSRRKLNPYDHEQYVSNMYAAFAALHTSEDVRALFQDLFTHTELTMLAKRLEVARRLQKEQTYQEIIDDMAVTDRTIANMSNTLATHGNGLRSAHEILTRLEMDVSKKARKGKGLF